MSSFKEIIEHILEYEGGLVDDPRDPGGITKYGISKRAFPSLDIKNLTKEQAIEIYRLHYWQKIKGEHLPSSLKLLVLDTAVNLGVKRAIRMLQKALGVKADGIIGPITLTAANSTPEALVVDRYARNRMQFYQRLKTWDHYGKGWSSRLLDVALLAAFDIQDHLPVHHD